jgi:uncharacterized LabA/DUF88 family protein
MVKGESAVRVGVYVDVANIAQNGGFGLRYEVLRRFACRDNAIPIRLNTYVVFDEQRAQDEESYRRRNREFHSVLRDLGFKVIEKILRVYTDEEGRVYRKANADLDMAVDALLQSDNLDRVLLMTGDGDFVQVVRALQNKGCRVEVVAFKNVSQNLRKEADLFVSGYLVPGLLRVPASEEKWGLPGSKVRGLCYDWRHDEGWGFIRYMADIGPGLWITDTRNEDSCFETAFAHRSAFPVDFDYRQLPSRDLILEFELYKSEKGLQARSIFPFYSY